MSAAAGTGPGADDPRRAEILAALRDVVDPELGLDIVELGLVYDVAVTDGTVSVALTMTSPACPMSEQVVAEATEVLRALPDVTDVAVRLVWDPPWTPARMSAAARAGFGWAG